MSISLPVSLSPGELAAGRGPEAGAGRHLQGEGDQTFQGDHWVKAGLIARKSPRHFHILEGVYFALSITVQDGKFEIASSRYQKVLHTERSTLNTAHCLGDRLFGARNLAEGGI